MELKRIEDVLGCIVTTNFGFGGLVTDIKGPNEYGSYDLKRKEIPGCWGNGGLGVVLKGGLLVMDEPTALILSGHSRTLIVKRNIAQKKLFEVRGGEAV
jgi:hypothetical protein